MLLYRCSSHPERKTFLASVCWGIRTCPAPSFPPVPPRCHCCLWSWPKPCSEIPKPHLPRAPPGTGSLKTGAKSAREGSRQAAEPERAEPAGAVWSPAARGAGASSLGLALTRSEPSWTLCAPSLKISHPNSLPRIRSAAIQQKISLYQDSSNTSQGKPDVK